MLDFVPDRGIARDARERLDAEFGAASLDQPSAELEARHLDRLEAEFLRDRDPAHAPFGRLEPLDE